MLTSLYLKNYCKHSDLEIYFTAKNIIYGLDQSGKSSILQAISFFAQPNFQFVKTPQSPQTLINKQKAYADIRLFSLVNNKKAKAKILIQENHLIFHLDERKTNLNPFYQDWPIVCFSPENNLFTNNLSAEWFLQQGTGWVFHSFLNEWLELQLELQKWQQKTTETSFQSNVYHLNTVQKTEEKIAQYFYQLTKYQLKFIAILNQKIEQLSEHFFNELKSPFYLKMTSSFTNCLKMTEIDFVANIKVFLLQSRNKNQQKQHLKSFVNGFVFVAKDNKELTSFKQKLFWDLFVQICLAYFLESELRKNVLFLVDDFNSFDFFNQQKIWGFISTFSQCIISTNQEVWKNWSFSKEVSLHKIKNGDE